MKCPFELNRRMMGWMKCSSGWMTRQIQRKLQLLSSFTVCNNGNDKYELKSKMKGLRFECWFMNIE